MKRKVSKIGPATLMVSLPSAWVRAYHIKKGDEVEITPEGSSLRIETQASKSPLRATVDVTGQHPMIKRILGALYKAGYQEMEVHYSTSKELELVQEVIREEFIGFELVEHHKTSIFAKEVTKVVFEEYPHILNRMIHILRQMAVDLQDATINKDMTSLDSIALRDKDINKHADFCRRILNQRDMEGIRNPPSYVIIEQLEKIGDLYRDLCLLQIKPKKEVSDLLVAANGIFDIFIDGLRDFSLKKMVQLAVARNDFRKKASATMVSKKDLPFYLKTCQLVDVLFDMNGPLMASKL
ncbi:MAG: AbrB/MazE/SpoVT family DNA-binding domain-containing protein [Nanoarchaeota archaeon]